MAKQKPPYYGVQAVLPKDNHQLLLRFDNGEERIFDLTPYSRLGRFAELKDPALFRTVKISFDAIEWDNHLDLDPEFLYQHSKKLETT